MGNHLPEGLFCFFCLQGQSPQPWVLPIKNADFFFFLNCSTPPWKKKAPNIKWIGGKKMLQCPGRGPGGRGQPWVGPVDGWTSQCPTCPDLGFFGKCEGQGKQWLISLEASWGGLFLARHKGGLEWSEPLEPGMAETSSKVGGIQLPISGAAQSPIHGSWPHSWTLPKGWTPNLLTHTQRPPRDPTAISPPTPGIPSATPKSAHGVGVSMITEASSGQRGGCLGVPLNPPGPHTSQRGWALRICTRDRYLVYSCIYLFRKEKHLIPIAP